MARNNTRKNTFSHRVVDAWNALNLEVVEALSLNSFKTRLNKMWNCQYISFMQIVTKPNEVIIIGKQ
jgi:hypothetical protein